MTVSTTTDAPVNLEADLLLLPVPQSPSDSVVEALSEWLGSAVERGMQGFEGNAGDVRVLYPEHTQALRIAFLGLGTASELDAEALRRAGAAGAAGGTEALDHEAETVGCLLPAVEPLTDRRTAQALVEGFVLGTYRYRRYKTADGFEGPSAFLMQVGGDRDRASVEEGIIGGQRLAEATCTARDLVNQSPDEKTALLFADTIAASGEEHGYQVETWDEDRIREEGMGGLLAVNRGSFDPPTFSVATWAPTDAAAERLYALQRAGERTGERVHPLPMYDVYKEYLESDIARPAFRQSAQTYQPKGGTGFGGRLLVDYLSNNVLAREQS